MGKKKRKQREKLGSPEGKNKGAARETGRPFGPVREAILFVPMALLVFSIYSNTLRGPFIFDDMPNIRNNPHVRMKRITLDDLREAAFESRSSNRPVANITFALNYYVHRYEVAGYRLVNILVHMMTAVFIYLLARTTLNLPAVRAEDEPNAWLPFLTALVWVVHPVQTQSVTYIVQRMNSMAAMFYILSLFLYARARLCGERKRKAALFVGAALSGVLALASKEVAATLPFFVFLYEWYFFQDLRWSWLRRRLPALVTITLVLALLAFLFLQTEASQRKLFLYDTKDFTPWQRVLTEFRVIIHYISLLVFPHPSRLNLDYDFRLSNSLVDPVSTLISALVIAGLIGLAIVVARKQRLISFCVLWFFGNLAIESSVIGLDIIFEHRVYLPSVLVSLMAVVLGYRYIRLKWLRVGASCIVVALLCLSTFQRNQIWADEETLWRDCVEKSPNKARPHLNLGTALHRLDKLEEATHHFNKVLEIDPKSEKAHNNLGVILKKQGQVKEAIAHYLAALHLRPDFATAHNNLGVALENLGQYEEAVAHHREALRINPEYPEAHNSLGVALEKLGKTREAVEHYSEALRIDPDFATAHYNLGSVFLRQGRLDEATVHFSRALQIKPDYAKASYNLGVALSRKGRLREAAFYFSEVLRVEPDHRAARRALDLISRQGALQ